MCGLGFVVHLFVLFLIKNAAVLYRREILNWLWLHSLGLDSQEMLTHSCITPPCACTEGAVSVRG